MYFHKELKNKCALPGLKSLAQEVRRKRDILKRKSKGSTLTLFATRLLGHCATCQESPYTKNEYNLFYQKLDADFFFNNFFEKSSIFKENCEEQFWERI